MCKAAGHSVMAAWNICLLDWRSRTEAQRRVNHPRCPSAPTSLAADLGENLVVGCLLSHEERWECLGHDEPDQRPAMTHRLISSSHLPAGPLLGGSRRATTVVMGDHIILIWGAVFLGGGGAGRGGWLCLSQLFLLKSVSKWSKCLRNVIVRNYAEQKKPNNYLSLHAVSQRLLLSKSSPVYKLSAHLFPVVWTHELVCENTMLYEHSHCRSLHQKCWTFETVILTCWLKTLSVFVFEIGKLLGLLR